MKNSVIAIDLDGVLAPLEPAWIARLNKVHGQEWRPEDQTTYLLEEAFGISHEACMSVYTPDIYDEIMPFEGAAAGLRALRETLNARIIVVTKVVSDPAFVPAKRGWVTKHFPGLIDEIRYVPMTEKKVAYVKDADVFIDDLPENFEDCNHCLCILFDAFWNARHSGPHARLSDWSELDLRQLRWHLSPDLAA